MDVDGCSAVPATTYAVRLHHTVTLPAGYQAQTLALRYHSGGLVLLQPGRYLTTSF